MKKIGLGIALFLGIIVVVGGVVFASLKANMKEINALPIEELNLDPNTNQVVRGMYYYENEIGATVDVTIIDGNITDIAIIEHLAGLGIKAEVITNDIISAQSLLVDDISGATTSSHVLKLAIQDALKEIQ